MTHGIVDIFGINDRDRSNPESFVVEAKATRSDFLHHFLTPEKLDAREKSIDKKEAEAQQRLEALVKEGQNRFGVYFDSYLGGLTDGHPRTDAEFKGWFQAARSAQREYRLLTGKKSYNARKRGTRGREMTSFPEANRYFVIAPVGMVHPQELDGWGLLEVDGMNVRHSKRSPRYELINKGNVPNQIRQIATRNMWNMLSMLDCSWSEHGIVLLKENLFEGVKGTEV